MTTKDEIRSWLERGKAQGATHVIVMCDTFDHEDYPVFVMPGEDPRARADKPGEMQIVMECYALHLDVETQLAEPRSHHYELPPQAPAAAPKRAASTKSVRDTYHPSLLEAWAAHQVFRQLGFPTDDIYVIASQCLGIGNVRFDKPRWGLLVELRTQGKSIVYPVQPFFKTKKEAYRVWKVFRDDFASKYNSGAFAEAEMHEIFQSSAIMRDKVALCVTLLDKGIVLPNVSIFDTVRRVFDTVRRK